MIAVTAQRVERFCFPLGGIRLLLNVFIQLKLDESWSEEKKTVWLKHVQLSDRLSKFIHRRNLLYVSKGRPLITVQYFLEIHLETNS